MHRYLLICIFKINRNCHGKQLCQFFLPPFSMGRQIFKKINLLLLEKFYLFIFFFKNRPTFDNVIQGSKPEVTKVTSLYKNGKKKKKKKTKNMEVYQFTLKILQHWQIITFYILSKHYCFMYQFSSCQFIKPEITIVQTAITLLIILRGDQIR